MDYTGLNMIMVSRFFVSKQQFVPMIQTLTNGKQWMENQTKAMAGVDPPTMVNIKVSESGLF